jgi:uncharacterized protein YgbK (DUF1537 family)
MEQRRQYIILDDDPTGIQTVHSCLAATCWDMKTLRFCFEDDVPFFYGLTNTRAVGEDVARRRITEAVSAVLDVNKSHNYKLSFICRSDSTLRGHFPLEIEEVESTVRRVHPGFEPDALFFIPAFFEAGRITKDSIHYVVDQGQIIPVHETPFARDSVFGYTSPTLPEYIEEKSNGRIAAEDVHSLSLEQLRSSSLSELEAYITVLPSRSWVVVNAEEYKDLKRFAEAMRRAMDCGKQFLFQSSSSFPKAITAVPDKPVLTGKELQGGPRGLVVIGSHVPNTTRQLEYLLGERETTGIEIALEQVLKSDDVRSNELKRIIESIENSWKEKLVPVVFTPRRELHYADSGERLRAGMIISRFLVTIVQNVEGPLSFLIAKGGITSHDILAEGLSVKVTRVLGQVLPGVPVLRMPDSHPSAGMPYIIFPGNVGGDSALSDVVGKLVP